MKLLKDLIENKQKSEKIFIKYRDKELTYHDFYTIVKSYCSILTGKRYRGKKIGIFLPNSIQYAIAYFVITFLDCLIIPIPIDAKSPEIKSTIDYCELSLILTDEVNKNRLYEYLNDGEVLIDIFVLDNNTFTSINMSRERISCAVKSKVTPDDVAIMLHTSGTTSHPKRVMLTHKNLISNVQSNISSLNLTENDKTLIALPMFFGYCNTAQFLTHVYLGASIVIMNEIFLPRYFFEFVEKEKITNFTGVPSMLLMLLMYRNRFKYDTSSLRYICFGGGNMPVDKLKQLIQLFPHTGLVQTYGQTEASPRVTALLPQDALKKIGSVGKPIPGVNVRIINQDGIDVKPGETGEIIVKGDNVMKGYFKRPEITEKTIRDRWLFTGDLARYDNEGYIYLIGRKKNIIISGGINIYPEEIEELLLSHSAIGEVFVYGNRHEILGEIPAAKVVINKEYKHCISPSDIMRFCEKNLSKYKVPGEVLFVDKLDKTKTGKIKRY